MTNRLARAGLATIALALTASTPSGAQSGGAPGNLIQVGYAGHEWHAAGNRMITLSGRVRVLNGKCIYDGRSKAASANYTTTERDEFVATPQNGGYLCTNGTYRIVGKDGKTWVGSLPYQRFVKGGKFYKFD